MKLCEGRSLVAPDEIFVELDLYAQMNGIATSWIDHVPPPQFRTSSRLPIFANSSLLDAWIFPIVTIVPPPSYSRPYGSTSTDLAEKKFSVYGSEPASCNAPQIKTVK